MVPKEHWWKASLQVFLQEHRHVRSGLQQSNAGLDFQTSSSSPGETWELGLGHSLFQLAEKPLVSGEHPSSFEKDSGSSRCGTAERNPTSNHEGLGLIPEPAQWAKDLVLPRNVGEAQIWHCCGCGVGQQL